MEKKKYGKQRDDHIVVLIGMIAAVLMLLGIPGWIAKLFL